jgi:hypothetical protein
VFELANLLLVEPVNEVIVFPRRADWCSPRRASGSTASFGEAVFDTVMFASGVETDFACPALADLNIMACYTRLASVRGAGFMAATTTFVS